MYFSKGRKFTKKQRTLLIKEFGILDVKEWDYFEFNSNNFFNLLIVLKKIHA